MGRKIAKTDDGRIMTIAPMVTFGSYELRNSATSS
jgi:hypothetical protein